MDVTAVAWRAMVRVAKLLLILPGLALVLAACGSVHAGTASPVVASSVRTTAPATVTWRTFRVGLNIVNIHLAGSGRVLMFPVQAPFGDKACFRDFTARLTTFGSTAAYVTITDQVALTPGPDGLAGYGCRQDRPERCGSSCPPRSAAARSSSTTPKPSGPPAPRG